MKILLVNPPYRRLGGVGSVYFPLGLGYLAAVLERANYEIKIYNGEAPRSSEECDAVKNYKGGDFSGLMSHHEEYFKNLKDDNFFVWQQFKKSLDDFRPDLVGILVRTPMLISALRTSRLVKEWNKNCIVVWGGPHATIMPEESMQKPEVNFLAYGEGEETLLQLVKTIEKSGDFSGINGIYYKDDSGKIIKNPAREYIKDLDKLPFPARHLVFDEDFYPEGSMLDLMGSRGCPFSCSYCSAHSLWGRNVRYRSVANVIEEVKVLRDRYNCTTIHFVDDSFTFNPAWVKELCEVLIREKLDVKWGCLTRVNLINDELLRIMVEAGCYRADVGVESGSPRILQMMRKGITLEDVLRGDRLFDKYGIGWTAFFITGFPYETMEDLKATLSFMKKINPYRIVLNNFTPYPATEDYERAKGLGVLPKDMDWGHFSHHSPDNFFMKNVDREEYREFFQNLSDYVSLRNTSRIRGREFYYLKHPSAFARKVQQFIKRRI